MNVALQFTYSVTRTNNTVFSRDSFMWPAWPMGSYW